MSTGIVAFPSGPTGTRPTVSSPTVTFTNPSVIGSPVTGSTISTSTVTFPAVLFDTDAVIVLFLGFTVIGTVMFVPLCTSSPG